MKFKDLRVEAEYSSIPVLLKIIVEDFDNYSRNAFQIDPTITRVLEPICGSSGVHEDNRAVDIRQEFDGNFTFSPTQESEILLYINNKYKRNDGKPTVMVHSFGGGPYHFHIQVAVFTKAYCD